MGEHWSFSSGLTKATRQEAADSALIWSHAQQKQQADVPCGPQKFLWDPIQLCQHPEQIPPKPQHLRLPSKHSQSPETWTLDLTLPIYHAPLPKSSVSPPS